MNIYEWLDEVASAYEFSGQTLTIEKRQVLLSQPAFDLTSEQQELAAEASAALQRYFFHKTSRSEAFGLLHRIETAWGRPLAERYGLCSGPFIDLAETFWTFNIERLDLMPRHGDLLLAQVLAKVESDIGAVFFPTAEANRLTCDERARAQRELLCRCAPEFDIGCFMANNPVLGTGADRPLSFKNAYHRRPVYFAVFLSFWLSIMYNGVKLLDHLTRGDLRTAGSTILWGGMVLVMWDIFHDWALHNPKN